MTHQERAAAIIATLGEHYIPGIGKWRTYLETALPAAFTAAEAGGYAAGVSAEREACAALAAEQDRSKVEAAARLGPESCDAVRVLVGEGYAGARIAGLIRGRGVAP
jgi:hypothetical protein